MSERNLTQRRLAYMATTAERIAIVEIKVQTLDEKVDDLKNDVKQVHDCLDRTGDELKAQLRAMHDASNDQHSELAAKISDLEKFRMKWTWMIAGAVAAAGIFSGHMDKILAFF